MVVIAAKNANIANTTKLIARLAIPLKNAAMNATTYSIGPNRNWRVVVLISASLTLLARIPGCLMAYCQSRFHAKATNRNVPE